MSSRLRAWFGVRVTWLVCLALFACGGMTQDRPRARGGSASDGGTAVFGAPAPLDECTTADGGTLAPWQLSNPARAREIEGYASATSVNKGEPILLFVNTAAPRYTLEVYRMGWYAGTGAERILGPVEAPGVVQKTPALDSFGAADCRWVNPVTIQTKTTWASGVYLVKLTTIPTGKQRYVVFVVRDDASHAALLFQSSVTTYEAYNEWGGRSLYSLPTAAVKVSFNRPYDDGRYKDGDGAGDFLFWEYPMIRWLEKEGYDVSYSTDVDTHQDAAALLQHKAFLSVGHDEYWTLEQRQHVEAARDHGVGLAFFSANTCYWQIRLEPSPAGDRDRTIVCYKAAVASDPDAQSPELYPYLTTQFRIPHKTSPPNPEETLLGVMYWYGKPRNETGDWRVQDATSWVFRGTGARTGDTLPHLLGMEVDAVWTDPGDLTTSAVNVDRILVQRHPNEKATLLAHSPFPYTQDGRNEYADSTVYEASSGAAVFAAGTVQWSWGLDSCRHNYPYKTQPTVTVQQISRNVLNHMTGRAEAELSP